MHDDFRRLIQPLESRLARAVWRVLQHADDADDALQDALSRIWTRIADVRSHANPEAFILRIALSSAHDVLRRRVRRRKIGDDGTADFDRVPSHDREGDPLEGAEVRGRVLAAVADLPTMQAEAFLLRVVDERSYAEIASALAVGESTARTHVERARRQLEKRLRPNFAERAEERP
ncbi:MAG: RNA polymerase sigma factor [Planctomycetota bacterium]